VKEGMTRLISTISSFFCILSLESISFPMLFVEKFNKMSGLV
jgi:hypothetical protein